MGILFLETGSNARPSQVYYDRDYSAFCYNESKPVGLEGNLGDTRWLHWTCITISPLSENAAQMCRQAIATANEMGVTVSCDINYRDNLWNYGKTATEVMSELVAKSDVILGNKEDCEKVFGIKPLGFDAEQTKGQVEQTSFASVCKQMMGRFPRCKRKW